MRLKASRRSVSSQQVRRRPEVPNHHHPIHMPPGGMVFSFRDEPFRMPLHQIHNVGVPYEEHGAERQDGRAAVRQFPNVQASPRVSGPEGRVRLGLLMRSFSRSHIWLSPFAAALSSQYSEQQVYGWKVNTRSAKADEGSGENPNHGWDQCEGPGKPPVHAEFTDTGTGFGIGRLAGSLRVESSETKR